MSRATEDGPEPDASTARAQPLVDALTDLRGAPARSFQLMGEDLALIAGAHLQRAGDSYREQLERLAPAMREPFEREQASLLREAHGLLVRHNRSVHGRLAGYLEMGRRCRFEYPWPVVAMLGISQVLGGFARARAWGLVGPAATRLGYAGLERLAEATDDVLRRTNRGIFADSVPTVLLGLRAHALRERGQLELAEALLDGPLPPVLDEEARAIARGLYGGLAIADRRGRFAALSALTLRHFDREQAIFSHHLGPAPRSRNESASRGAGALLGRLLEMRAVPAPVVERGLFGRRLTFRPFPLPAGFDIREHGPRVDVFGRAFVSSVTLDEEDYATAVRYVARRFGGPAGRHLAYGSGA
jgi:hypothetical protein